MSEPLNVQILSAYDEDGDIDLDFAEAAAKIAKDRDLGITRDRELHYVAMIDDEVVGAAWIAFDGENYEFDIAVARGFGRNGIGRSLVGAVIADREFVCAGREGTTMLVCLVTDIALWKKILKSGIFMKKRIACQNTISLKLSSLLLSHSS